MKITCSKSVLEGYVSKIGGVVKSKTSLPVLNNFLLSCKAKSVNLLSTDLEMSIKCVAKDIDVGEEGDITIPAKKFMEILRELPDAEVKITSTDKNAINIKCEKTSYKIMGLSKEDFPPNLEKIKNGTGFKIKGSILIDMIKKTVFAVSSDETRKIISGVGFVVEKNKLILIGTDGHKLSYIKSDIDKIDKPIQVIVPTKVLNELSKLMVLDMNVDVLVSSTQIMFDLGDVIVTSRLIEGQYPDYNTIINKTFDKKVKVKKDDFLKVVKRVSILSDNHMSSMVMNIEGNKILIAQNVVDVGEATEEMVSEYTGENMGIHFNPEYIISVLKVIDTEYISIELKDSVSAGRIKQYGDDNFIYIIMPVRG